MESKENMKQLIVIYWREKYFLFTCEKQFYSKKNLIYVCSFNFFVLIFILRRIIDIFT